MRSRSDIWKAIASRGDFKEETVAVIDGVTYEAISAPVINRALISDKLSVGNCISASLQFSVLTQNTIPSAAAVVIKSRLTDGERYSEWLEMGTFYIHNRKENKDSGLLTLQCYDAMLKANQPYVDSSNDDDRIGWPKTMKACVEEIAYRIGVEIDPRTVIKTSDPYQVDYPTKYTMMTVLGYIGAVHGGNWIITPENKLRLVPLISPPAETFDIIDEYYNPIYTDDGYKLVWQHAENEDATEEHPAGGDFCYVPVVIGSIDTGKAFTITRVTVARDQDLGYTGGDDTSFELRIEENPYASQAVCDDLLAWLAGVEYAPYTVEGACYDPAAELGDWVVVGDRVRSVLYVETVTLNVCFRANISAPGNDELESEYPYLTSIEKLKQADERLQKYMDGTKVYLDSKIEQTYEQITLEVDLLKETDDIVVEAIAQLNLAVDGISLSAVSKDGGSYLTLNNGENSSEVALSLTVSNDKTESTIKLTAGDITIASETIKFSGFVTFEGLSGGTTTIDGACIKTGTIAAERLSLNLDNYATKSYVTSEITALENGLALSVSNGSYSSTISLTLDGITLSSKSITFSGMVTFSDLSTSGWTTINGDNITTGTLNASYLELANAYGGFCCAYGYNGESYTYGAMVYGSDPDYYFIATGSGVRMQASSTYFYCSTKHIVASEAISETSDARKKNSVSYDMDRYEKFYLALSPCYYKLNAGTSDRYHSGFIAQEVETALADNGLTNQDFAGLTIYEAEEEDENGERTKQTEYALRYGEFIALNTYMIQRLYERVSALEETVKQLGG